MTIAAIWAEDEKRLIGVDGHLPWRLPAELAHFKATTMGQSILMGRKTYEGMNKRVLPGRTSIVLTKQADYDAENEAVLVMHSVDEVLAWYQKQADDLYIIGGAEILKAFDGHYEKLYQTLVHGEFEGDAYFPENLSFADFELLRQKRHEQDEKNPYAFTVKEFGRLK
ncbi:dihydrofolate reductase [Lactococcus termiticola]|uniref:Dihydrofolate reductase n=1 Tax=Lactococcus termiticola TaxID=2169526 RepID=A0A2R5HKH8_9LACT|nr:dihydrofolate reductase [Lactococcus termiticola]GBG97071.1 dihydrofolate reductase [Lactococcus termiticola]